MADLFEAAQDDAVWRWLPLPRPDSEQDVRQLVRDHPGRPAWAVLVGGRAVGSSAYLDVDLGVGGLEIGWTWYARSAWGGRVNPECKLLRHARLRHDGSVRDTTYFSILTAEWPAVRTGLQARLGLSAPGSAADG